jgi:hypothetical protein
MENKLNSIFKNIKEKIVKNNSDSDIVGIPDYKTFSDKDLIPLPSLFGDNNDNPLGKSVARHLNNVTSSFDRDDRYERYRLATKVSEIDGALNIYASEIATQDSKGEILNVFTSSAKVKKIIEDMFERLGLTDQAYEIIKSMCTYGDEFYEILYAKSGKAIAKINPLPREMLGRYEENGTLKNFFFKPMSKKNVKDSYYSFDYTKKNTEEKIEIEPYKILHWRIPSSEYSPYGKSILDSVIVPIEELRLMEQSLLIARLSRAPERRIYQVNVGQAQGEKGIAMAREIVKGIKKKNILDRNSGKLESNMDFFGSSEDIIIPFRKDEEKSTIDTLPQLSAQDLGDLEFIRDRIFPGLGIPRQYLFDDTFANANTNLSNKSVQFAKRIRRIQKDFLYPIYKLAYIELRLKNVNPKEYIDLLITMNNPSNVDIREKYETETNKWNLISSVKSLNAEKVFYNDFFIYQEILGLNYDEILQLMIFNVIQEKTLNPFNFVPEDKRPPDWQTLDQIRNEGGEAPAEGEGGEEGGGEEIPPEAQQAFGGEEGGGEKTPPEEGEGGETPPEGGEGNAETPPAEGGEEPVEGADEIDKMFDSFKINGKNSTIYMEALNKARKFSSKKLKKIQEEIDKKVSKEKLMKNPLYTVPMYSENYLEINLEFKGLQNDKKIQLG